MKFTIKQLKQLIKEQIEEGDGYGNPAEVEDKTTLELAAEIAGLKEKIEELESMIRNLDYRVDDVQRNCEMGVDRYGNSK